MGFFSWIWEWIIKIKDWISGESRYTAEGREIRDEKEAIKSTKKQMKLEREERILLTEIIKLLEEIINEIHRSGNTNTIVRFGNQGLDVRKSVEMLIQQFEYFVKGKISIKQEEITLGNIGNYWRTTRQALLTFGIVKKADEVSVLLSRLGIELKLEEELSKEKDELTRDVEKLEKEEEGEVEGQPPQANQQPEPSPSPEYSHGDKTPSGLIIAKR